MNCLLTIMLLLASDRVWTEEGEGYSIMVTRDGSIPEVPALVEALDGYASSSIEGFMSSFRELTADFPEPMPWNLEISFTHEPSPSGMVCVMAWTWEYSGGAHGNSWTRAFILNRETGELVEPYRLFAGIGEFEVFAGRVMKSLRQELGEDFWIEEGASATPGNYHSLLPVPDESGAVAGYRVVFPPYQVAPYVFGPMEVFVPD